MTLEQQVASLELSKRLRELGVRQESLWSWCRSVGKPWNEARKGTWNIQLDGPEENEPNSIEQISAFTVAELGELMKNHGLESGWFEDDQKWWAFFTLKPSCHKADTEADARAKALIYLLENNLVKVEDL